MLLVIRLSPMAELRLYKIAHCNQSVLRRVGQWRDFSGLGTPASHRVEPVVFRCTAGASFRVSIRVSNFVQTAVLNGHTIPPRVSYESFDGGPK